MAVDFLAAAGVLRMQVFCNRHDDLPCHLEQRSRDAMAELKSGARKALPKSKFGLPGERAYPMPDRAHAANAKARAAQQKKRGRLSAAQKSKIDAKANKVLRKQ